jgi:hypothetical protein
VVAKNKKRDGEMRRRPEKKRGKKRGRRKGRRGKGLNPSYI